MAACQMVSRSPPWAKFNAFGGGVGSSWEGRVWVLERGGKRFRDGFVWVQSNFISYTVVEYFVHFFMGEE